MLHNYLVIAYRNILRHKVFSFINVFGLAIGMAACLIIIQYASFELSYDDFHKQADRIYRVRFDLFMDGKLQASIPKNFTAAGPALKRDFPEVENFVRIFPIDGTIAIKRDEVVFNEKGIYFVDPSFLQVFSYPLLQGDASTALSEPNTVVITSTVARKYFGDENPLGKRLVLREDVLDIPLLIKGIIADVPENSHLDFDFLVSHATLIAPWGEQRADKDWGSAPFYTYILLKPNTNIATVEAKFPAFVKKYTHFPSNAKVVFEAQPLQDIYLRSNLVQEAKVNGSSKEVYFLLLIALLIIVIAWFNYINLSTARSIERAKEVGIRKVAGANRFELMKQFIFESLLFNILAVVLALTLVQLSLPYFVQLTGKPLLLWNNLIIIPGIVFFFLAGAVFSAVYPGLILSSFKPVSVLKGKFRSSAAGSALRKGFTVVQFAASITLIIGTLTVYQQLSYMRSKDLGMNINQTLVLNNPDIVDSTFTSKMRFFKDELSKHKEISYVVSSTSIPGKTDNLIKNGLMLSGTPKEVGITHYGFQVDHHFIEAYDIKFLAGRNFSKEFSLDKEAIVINLAALQALGLQTPEEAIGKKAETNWTNEKTIIGVVDNFHQSSLKTAYDPIVFVLDESAAWGYYSIKLNLNRINDKNLNEVIATINEVWNQAFPGNPFDYFFLDEYFNEQYQSDQRFGKAFALFSALAIIVACLGLFALVSFTTTQRTKEIGVRKVLGASISHIILLLSKNFMQWVLVANLITWPVAYWIIKQWLQNYAFRIEINIWLFIWPTLLILLIAFLTISIQTIKAARTNPVKELRYE